MGVANPIEALERIQSHMLVTGLVDTNAGFEALREEWNDLLRASDNDNFFLTWEWLHTWWKHMAGGQKPHIVTVRHGGRLVALAPMAVRPAQWHRLMPFRTLGFMGCGNVGSDYLSVIVRKGYEDPALRALTGSFTEGDFPLPLEFSHVDRTNAQMEEVALQLCQLGWRDHRATIEYCPYIGLEGHTWESYLNALGTTHRTNFKRKVKKLNQLYKLRIEEAKTDSERRAALDVLVNLHLKRRSEVGGSDALHTQGLLDFHDEMTASALRRGWLRLQVMWLDDRPVAAMYGFEYNKVFYFYQSGFDSEYATYSVGLVMAGLVIKTAIEAGIREFDFLHGNERYKYLWASAERELLRFHFFPPHGRGALMDRLMRARKGLKRALKRDVQAERPALTARPAPTHAAPTASVTNIQEAE